MTTKLTDRDKRLLVLIAETPNNLQFAFDKVAQEFNCSSISVSQSWYSKLKKNTELVATFGIASKVGVVANIKNTPRPQEDSFCFTIAELAIQKLNKKEKLMLIQKMMHVNIY